MNNSINKLVEKASGAKFDHILESYARANGWEIGPNGKSREEVAKSMEAVTEALYAQFTHRNFEGDWVEVPELSITEALNTTDASIVFPRVISEVLQEPKEPALFLTNNVAETFELGPKSPLHIEFPTVGALQAFEISEGQEYPQQTLSFQQHMTSIRLKKIGLSASLTDEIINQSMWPLVRLYLKLMNNAVDRKIESLLFQAMTTYAQVVFDNNMDPAQNPNWAQYRTTGKSVSGSVAVDNGSFSYHDLVKMCGVLLGNRYNATHFLAHPLAWPVFATDPIMRAQFYHGGQLGAGIWSTAPDFDQSVNMPFGGIQYVPYYALPYGQKVTFAGTGSSFGQAGLVTDFYLIDKSNSLYLATRGPAEMDQMDNWLRDATQMKIRKYAGVAAKDGGRAMAVARDVRVVPNQEPLFTIRQVNA